MFKPKTPKTTDVWAKDASAASGPAAAVTPSALTYIGTGSELRGDLRAAGNLRIAVIGKIIHKPNRFRIHATHRSFNRIRGLIE